MPTKRNNLKSLEKIRKKLRRNATPEEDILWKYLRKKRRLGYKFRRQHSIDYYVLDFYCPALKLAIEADGAQHYTQAGLEKDAFRDTYLQEEFGILTLRFENELVRNRLPEVLHEIERTIHERAVKRQT